MFSPNMSGGHNESGKRGRKWYVAGHKSKRWKGSRELEVGMQGILITCNMNQRKCTAEALNLLGEYADKLYGPEKGNNGSSEEEEDVDVALKREVALLQAAGAKQEMRFQALDSGANNVIFIRTQNLEPDKLVHHILTDIHTTKKKKSRVILRMLPVTGTCRAFPDDMLRYMSSFLEPWFKKPNSSSYQIAFKARNSSHHKREELIKAIAALVGKLNHKNKVNLTSPKLTIIVEVIKAVCCISVVKDYPRYRKYNLQEIVKEEPPKPDVTTAKMDETTTEQEEKSETNQEEKKGEEEENNKTVQEKKSEEEEENNKTVQEKKVEEEENNKTLQEKKGEEEEEEENNKTLQEKKGEEEEEEENNKIVQEKKSEEEENNKTVQEKKSEEEEEENNKTVQEKKSEEEEEENNKTVQQDSEDVGKGEGEEAHV